MAKRSDFKRIERDFYPTPLAAVKPLAPHLPDDFMFCEPCSGDGRLTQHIRTLKPGAACSAEYDLEPLASHIMPMDARDITRSNLCGADLIITNPPWIRTKQSGYLLHDLITTFSDLAPTWLLFDAGWAYTQQSRDLIKRCSKIVAIGRVKWIEDSAGSGKDDAAWYLFDAKHEGPTEFHGRTGRLT